MSTQPSTDDLWGWLHSQPAPTPTPWATVSVTAYLEGDADQVAALRQLLADQSVEPEVVIEGTAPADSSAEWLWLVPGDVIPQPEALRHLLVALADQPSLDVIGPLLAAPRRRGTGTLISQFGQSINGAGRLRPLVDPGELHQGQLEPTYSLGVDVAGMLVRGEVWRSLHGLNRSLPVQVQGLEFGWRAVLAGYLVVVEPTAVVIDRRIPGELAEERAAGLAVVASHARPGLRWASSLRLGISCLLAALGLLIAKAPGRAAAELAGWWRWRRNPARNAALRAAVAEVTPTARTRDRVRGLRPTLGDGLRRAGDSLADRLASWFDTFTARGDGAGIDELTGDDFASTGRTARISTAVVGLVGTTVLALMAARTVFGTGTLRATLLLPAPESWLDLIAGYVSPVPGPAGLAGPVWTGLAGFASLVTLGNPDLLVAILVVAAVPVSWLLGFRLLRRLVANETLAGCASFGYALAPVLTGALNDGALGAVVWTILLPVFGFAWVSWRAQPRWRGAAALAGVALMAVAVLPLAWVLVLVVAVVMGWYVRRPGQAVLVGLSPAVIGLGDWSRTLAAFPGRLLTGIEPGLGTLAAPQPWEVLLARTGSGAAPIWVAAGVGLLWCAGFIGAARHAQRAAGWLAAAVGFATVAILLTRLIVDVPPGVQARPSGTEWVIAMVAALVVAAAIGLDGVVAELRGASLGVRHVTVLGMVGVSAAALLLAGGWWLVAGQTQLTRQPLGSLPAFIANQQTSATPGRTLAISIVSGVRWSLVEGDYLRWGEAETGGPFGGDQQATRLAASVVSRLVAGSADDQLLGDLRQLGVSAVWLSGGEESQRSAISNTPGLGLGTGDEVGMVWLVPGSGLAVTDDGSGPVVTGVGAQVSAGTLRLAEPADPRWWASVDGVRIAANPGGDLPGVSFTLPHGGRLDYGLSAGVAWWAWLQAAALAALILLAAPGARTRAADHPVGRRGLEGAR